MTIDVVMTRSVPAEAIRTKEPSKESLLVGLGVILGISSSEPVLNVRQYCDCSIGTWITECQVGRDHCILHSCGLRCSLTV